MCPNDCVSYCYDLFECVESVFSQSVFKMNVLWFCSQLKQKHTFGDGACHGSYHGEVQHHQKAKK